jgi:hypothetical protein
VLVVFRPHPGDCLTVLHRDDGVVLELSPVSRTWRVPHDMAHVATELALDLRDGVFGTLAAGGVLGNMRVVQGRSRHDSAARSARLLTANSSSLTTAELLARAVHAGVEHGRPREAVHALRRQWASRHPEPCPWTDGQILGAVESLNELDGQWQARGPDEGVEVVWPRRLTSAVPRPRRPPRSRPRSRR